MIEAIELNYLRNPEYIQFMKDAIGFVDVNDPIVLQVEPQYETLRIKTQECDALFKLPLANERTKGLTLLDARRDKAVIGMSLVSAAYLNYFDPIIATAAQHLHDNIKLYGRSIARQSYQAESATISSMLNDWVANPTLANAIVVLNLRDWKDELIDSNDAFMALYNQRTQDFGAEPTDNLLGKRAETNGAYYALTTMLAARKLIANDNSYDKIYADLNASIEQYNTLINNRKARNKKNKPEDDDEDDDAPDPTDD